MRRKIALFLAVVTAFLSIPALAFGGSLFTPTGSARKACAQEGGTWTPYLQVCNH